MAADTNIRKLRHAGTATRPRLYKGWRFGEGMSIPAPRGVVAHVWFTFSVLRSLDQWKVLASGREDERNSQSCCDTQRREDSTRAVNRAKVGHSSVPLHAKREAVDQPEKTHVLLFRCGSATLSQPSRRRSSRGATAPSCRHSSCSATTARTPGQAEG